MRKEENKNRIHTQHTHIERAIERLSERTYMSMCVVCTKRAKANTQRIKNWVENIETEEQYNVDACVSVRAYTPKKQQATQSLQSRKWNNNQQSQKKKSTDWFVLHQ